MAYATYTTEALVCGTFNQNGADRSYLLFTREAGMLFAEAKSVREERSRQRYALQDFSRIRVSLVRGKRSWKIGSVEVITNDFMSATSRAVRGSVVVVYRTLRRFIHGEEASPDLFDFCREALMLIHTETVNRNFIELLIRVRVLLLLGYVDTQSLPPQLRTATLLDSLQAIAPQDEVKLNRLVEQAIEHSQL